MSDDKNTKFTYSTLRYDLSDKIGEGTFGEVYKGFKNDQEFAIKKLHRHCGGIQLSTVREIKCLRDMHHENIISLLEINVYEDDVFLVFPYFRFDLTKYLARNIPNKKEIVHIIRQLADGLAFLHGNKIIHRDLKPGNILLDFNLNVKIADFGMVRTANQSGVYSPGVVTLWYRAPEVILGAQKYDYKIDIWSLGCIAAEMILGHPLFQTNSEIKMLENLIYICGPINKRTWPDVVNLPNYSLVNLPQSPRNLRKFLDSNFDDVVDLIDQILVVDPSARPTAKDIVELPVLKSHDIDYINEIEKDIIKETLEIKTLIGIIQLHLLYSTQWP